MFLFMSRLFSFYPPAWDHETSPFNQLHGQGDKRDADQRSN